jgi:hypothetical protein
METFVLFVDGDLQLDVGVLLEMAMDVAEASLVEEQSGVYPVLLLGTHPAPVVPHPHSQRVVSQDRF